MSEQDPVNLAKQVLTRMFYQYRVASQRREDAEILARAVLDYEATMAMPCYLCANPAKHERARMLVCPGCAETLREERDAARARVAELEAKVARLRAALGEKVGDD
jgi:hypothetical protein